MVDSAVAVCLKMVVRCFGYEQLLNAVNVKYNAKQEYLVHIFFWVTMPPDPLKRDGFTNMSPFPPVRAFRSVISNLFSVNLSQTSGTGE